MNLNITSTFFFLLVHLLSYSQGGPRTKIRLFSQTTAFDSISTKGDTLIFYNQDSIHRALLSDLDSTNELIDSISFKEDTLRIYQADTIFKTSLLSYIQQVYISDSLSPNPNGIPTISPHKTNFPALAYGDTSGTIVATWSISQQAWKPACDTFYTPIVLGDTLLFVNSCTNDTIEVFKVDDNTIQCYLQERPVDEPTNATTATANKGYIKQTLYVNSQFPNLLNTGIDTAARPEALLNQYGVLSMNGDHTTPTNVSTVTYNEFTSYGDWVEWEGYIYIPIRYPDAPSGKYVTKFEIFDSYTNSASYGDCDYLYVAESGGVYSLEEKDLKLKLNCPASGSQPSFQFNQSQAGRWARFKLIHSDLGGYSQVNWDIRLTYEDNTTQVFSLNPFVHNIDYPIYHTVTEKVKLVYDASSGIWTENGTPLTVNTALGNLQRIDCNNLQVSFNVYQSGNTYEIQSVFGGDGTYEYSIDGCYTFQASPIFNLDDYCVKEILPCVRTGDGSTSAQVNVNAVSNITNATWSVNYASAGANATSYDDGLGESGWTINYSNLILTDNLSTGIPSLFNELFTNNANSWTLMNNVLISGGFLVFNGTDLTPNGVAEKSVDALIGQTIPVGQTIQFEYDFSTTGVGAGTVGIQVDIIDATTSTIIATQSHTGGSGTNQIDRRITATGTGNPLIIRFTDISTATLSIDPRIDNLEISYGGKWLYNGDIDFTGGLLYINLGEDYVGAASAQRIVGNTTLGQEYTMAYDRYFVYYGSGTSNINVYFEAVDSLTGTVLSSINETFTGQWLSNVLDNRFSFIGTGNPVYFRIRDLSSTGGTADATGHYTYVDNVRFFEGEYSDADEYFNRWTSTYLLARQIKDTAVLTSDAHTINSCTDMVYPYFRIVDYGAVDPGSDGFIIEYQLDNGVWQFLVENDGLSNAANKIQFDTYFHEKGVYTGSASTIRYRIKIYGNGTSGANDGYYIYVFGDNAR